MATGPAEAFGRVKRQDNEEYSKVCAAIEEGLADIKIPGNPRVWLDTKPSPAVRKRVREEYKGVGWSDVKFGGHQTQGEWVDMIR